MEYKNVYEEYKKEHPEEMKELNSIYKYSKCVRRRLDNAKKEKLAKVEECRRILYGKKHSV